MRTQNIKLERDRKLKCMKFKPTVHKHYSKQISSGLVQRWCQRLKQQFTQRRFVRFFWRIWSFWDFFQELKFLRSFFHAFFNVLEEKIFRSFDNLGALMKLRKLFLNAFKLSWKLREILRIFLELCKLPQILFRGLKALKSFSSEDLIVSAVRFFRSF